MLTANVTKGTLAMNADGAFTCTSPANFTGNATFRRRAKEDTTGRLSDEVSVTLIVESVR